jgi:hypothetical protein
LKDSRDLDAAFRLSFNGGWTHSSNGVLPNGTNGYANTFLTPSTSLTQNSTHLSNYVRTNSTSIGADIGSSNLAFANGLYILPRFSDNVFYGRFNDNSSVMAFSNTNSIGYYIGSRSALNTSRLFKNNVLAKNDTTSSSGLTTFPISIGAGNVGGTQQFSNRQLAFATIGDGLTDTEASNLYYSVQKFQTTLGRQVGTPIYSSNATDVNARLFLGATNIQDVTITSAVDTLVQGLKTDGVWSKLKAVYPFVGGTATTHKFNLANALDEDSAFRLAFSGGITHTSNGVQGNGINGIANTNLNISSNLSLTDTHLSFYSRTNLINNGFGSDIASDGIYNALSTCSLRVRNSIPGGIQYFTIGADNGAGISNTNGLGLTLGTASDLRLRKLFQNGVLKVTQTTLNNGTLKNNNVTLLGGDATYSFNQCAFASIGNNLTDTEALNLYTRVQAFQTILNRAII